MINMVFTVSVRDLDKLEDDMRSGKKLEIPEECVHNSSVFYKLMDYVPSEKVPEMLSLTQGERKLMSDIVSYAVRPDLIKRGRYSIGPTPLNPEYPKKLIGGNVTIKNNPEDLKVKGWKIPDEYIAVGAELFRCLGFARIVIPTVHPKFKNLPFDLADSLAYLLEPDNLTDYLYTKEEINKFHETLMKEAMTV